MLKEIREGLEMGTPFQAERRRLGKAKVYTFNRQRLGKFYEPNPLVTVTVYVFYGKSPLPAVRRVQPGADEQAGR